MTRAPFFSVVMPAYNAVNYLSPAIESVLAQTSSDWELIVVDDTSSDGTPGILAGYAAKYPNIRVLRNEANSGAARSLNRGIAEARGEWIVHLDADDLFTPNYLEMLSPFISTLLHAHCFVSTWVTVVDAKGESVLDLRLPSAEKITRMMKFENFLYHSATSFPKQVWERVGGYPDADRKLCEDAEMWKRLLRSGISLFMVPEPLVLYRIHNANFTSFKDGQFVEAADRNRVLAQQYHDWRASLFLKQGKLQAARHEILLLKKSQRVFSIKNLFYYMMTLLPKFVAYGFMWEIRPRLRRWVKDLRSGSFQVRHSPS